MSFLFYLFSALALLGGIGVVISRNPVTSAISMVVSFLGLAALFIQLDAFLVGVLQILVYAGAIMVLFLFIIMLLDVREEEKRRRPIFPLLGAGLVVFSFLALLSTVLSRGEIGKAALPALKIVGGPGSSDVHRIGELLFSHYWFPVQVVGILLLVATVGVVVLSRKELK
ncbi:MAG: NADH-quinone oxidoreductase subunit J [Verrucomicrobiales bacterium]|jgi:NADH-quinone oxidoreductase subunit J|nr:NADH-quinone oxidoreductase subunit J [Verrucomicrobiales bacterium]MBP9225854.1 NADH-quinone oxidoreductase subunit J [Verrucomicrobiales bacterium]HQZ27316.1 NADH-quinone oxidoreductase subunit J [Verrucomicrobiales bacterium]